MVTGVLTMLCLALPPIAAGAGSVVVTPQEMSRHVEVKNVSVAEDGSVSGVLVNRASGPVRDVGLLITHSFLWKNEFRPGKDNPSRAEYYTVRGEIPPGSELAFRVRSDTPLPARRDGRFNTMVSVAQLMQMEPGTSSPTAGYGASPTPRTTTEESAPARPAPSGAPTRPAPADEHDED